MGSWHRETEIPSRTANKNCLEVCAVGSRPGLENGSRVRSGLQVKGDLEWDWSMNGVWVQRVSPRD